MFEINFLLPLKFDPIFTEASKTFRRIFELLIGGNHHHSVWSNPASGQLDWNNQA